MITFSHMERRKLLCMHSPISSLAKQYMLFDLHDLDMIEVFRSTSYYFANRVYLTLLDDPRLCSGDDVLWCPSW